MAQVCQGILGGLSFELQTVCSYPQAEGLDHKREAGLGSMQGVCLILNLVAEAVDFPGMMCIQQSRAEQGWPRLLQGQETLGRGCLSSVWDAEMPATMPWMHQWQRKKHVSFLPSSHGICICQVLHCTRQTTSYKTDGWLRKKPLTHHAACHSQSNRPKEMLNHIWGTAVAISPPSRGKQQQHLCSSQPTLTFGDSSCMWITALWNNTRRMPLET